MSTPYGDEGLTVAQREATILSALTIAKELADNGRSVMTVYRHYPTGIGALGFGFFVGCGLMAAALVCLMLAKLIDLAGLVL